jgi:hypothetical protein
MATVIYLTYGMSAYVYVWWLELWWLELVVVARAGGG